MAYNFKLSQAAATNLLSRQGCKYVQGTTISFDYQYSASYDRISTTILDFSVFKVGDKIYVEGSTSNDITSGVVVRAVTSTTIDIDTGSLALDEMAGDNVMILCSDGGSFRDLFNYGTLVLYGGTQRTRPDDLTTETPLAIIPGITFADATWLGTPDFKATMAVAESIISSAAASGMVTWFCLCRKDHGYAPASTIAVRCDGSVGESGSFDLLLSETTLNIRDPVEITTSTVFRLGAG